MVVDAVMSLDELMSLKMIGIKKVQGGALEVSIFIVAAWFKIGCGISYVSLNVAGVPVGHWGGVQEDLLLRWV